MNSAQFQSMFRAGLLMLGTMITKNGVTDSATWETVVGFLVGLVPIVWSWCHHSDPTAPKSGGVAGLWLAAGLWFALGVTGCGTIDRLLLVPHDVIAATTNLVQTASGSVETVTPAVTNYAVAPKVVAAVQTGQTIAATVPTPWSWIAAGLLGLTSAGLGLYAKVRSGQLSTSQSMITAVVAGVEAAGASAGSVKVSIQNAAAAAGVQGQLDPLVQKITASM